MESPETERVQSYRQLRVFDRAMRLVDEVYRIAALLPDIERFALAQQLRRAAVSVAANIAEGHARSTTGEFANQLSISRGSTAEVEVLLLVTERHYNIGASDLVAARDHCDAIMRMITMLKRKLTAKKRR